MRISEYSTALPQIITELGDHSVPKNWEQFVAKRDAEIPTSQNFKTHKKVNAAKNRKSERMGIEYEFEVAKPYGNKESRFVQDHYEGHVYMDGRVDNTQHFNIHQKKDTTTIKGENNHYPYVKKGK